VLDRVYRAVACQRVDQIRYNIRKYNWTSPDGKSHNQIDHFLIDRRWHLRELDVLFSREAKYVTDHHLVVAIDRVRPTVSKQTTCRFRMERFSPEKVMR
jgi:hypothetical protein